MLVVLLVLIVIVIFVLIFLDLNKAGENIMYEQLPETANKIDSILLKNNIYLIPDMAYLTRIKPLFYTSLPGGNEIQYFDMLNSSGIIKNIIQKTIYFNHDISSIYILLEDRTAPYVLVNGDLRLKLSIEDADWIPSCFSMNSEYYFEWRTMHISFVGEIDAFSVYRKINSVNWQSGEVTEGYIVINYDWKIITNQINEILGYGRSINLFNKKENQVLSIGKNVLDRDSAERITVEWLRSNITSGGSGGYVAQRDQTVYIGHIQDSPLYYILTQDGLTLGEFLGNLRNNLLLILIIVGIIILILYINTYIQSEKILRTEMELLYGRTQLNSHFLLNAMDYIYWKGIHKYGIENKETEMIEKLCAILKYTLDSSGTKATLEEEINYAKLYLEMQMIRKDITLDVEWIIPAEALKITTEKLITQTILENSIQHGMYTMGKELKIRVNSVIDNKYLYLYFEDSGQGMKDEEITAFNESFKEYIKRPSNHIGLSNINRRLKIRYGSEYGITLRPSELGGLCVEIKLPFDTNQM